MGGQEFARVLGHTRPTKVLTAETSGIAPALATATALSIPVVFARKHAPLTMNGTTVRELAISRTHEHTVELLVSSDYMTPQDRILIVDDFLATSQTIQALIRLVEKSGAELVGIGAVIEKSFEGGRRALDCVDIPIVSLVVITSMDDGRIVFQE